VLNNPIAYNYDHDSALFSRPAFSQVLDLIRSNAKIANVYVVAHSMGNQIVVDALAEINRLNIRMSLAELVLAAPDVSVDIFRSLADHLKNVARGITLYASSADKALLASIQDRSCSRASKLSTSQRWATICSHSIMECTQAAGR
jgi:esterase/lipase superfamily enzyme